METMTTSTLFHCSSCMFVCTDEFHSSLHQKFNHSGVDSGRLKKLLFEYVTSFIDSHRYYKNQALVAHTQRSRNLSVNLSPQTLLNHTFNKSSPKRGHKKLNQVDEDYVPSKKNSSKKKSGTTTTPTTTTTPQSIFRSNEKTRISKETLASIENHLNYQNSKEQPSTNVIEVQEECESNTEIDDEIAVLDCEFEIIHSEGETETSSLINSTILEIVESTESIPKATVSDENTEEVEDKLPPKETNDQNQNKLEISTCDLGAKPFDKSEVEKESPINEEEKEIHSESLPETANPTENDAEVSHIEDRKISKDRKKRFSEDIPNTLKIPEKRISRSGRECRGVIPFTIDNPRHYSVKKLKNSQRCSTVQKEKYCKKKFVNGLPPKENDPGEAKIEEISLDENLGSLEASDELKVKDKDKNHMCQVCGQGFCSESQLFNHFDSVLGKRTKCASFQDHKRWKKEIQNALEKIKSNGDFGNFDFENQKQLSNSKTKFSPVWYVFSKIRFNGELLPYVFHHERDCDYVVHWSGSTSCLKRHVRQCPHVGKGTYEMFDKLRVEFNKEELLQFVNSDETSVKYI